MSEIKPFSMPRALMHPRRFMKNSVSQIKGYKTFCFSMTPTTSYLDSALTTGQQIATISAALTRKNEATVVSYFLYYDPKVL